MKAFSLKNIVISTLIVGLLLEFSSRLFLNSLYEKSNGLEISWGETKLPHPFFGYQKASKISMIRKAYNIEQRNKFVVGFFGGSVASQLYSQELKRSFSIAEAVYPFAGKESLDVVDFSIGGGKQPRQLNMAAVYSDKIDIALSVEGNNELIYFNNGLFPHYFPALDISAAFFSQYSGEEFSGATVFVYSLNQWLRTSLYNNDSWLQSVRLAKLVFLKQTRDWLYSNVHDKLSVEKGATVYGDGIFNIGENFRFWMKMSCLQQNIFSEENKINMVFVQPFPYLYKEMSPEEKAMGLNPGEKKYKKARALLSSLEFHELRKSGLNIYSLLKVFENKPETYYTDNCCHLTRPGRALILKEMAKSLKEILSSDTSIKRCDWRQLSKIIESQLRKSGF